MEMILWLSYFHSGIFYCSKAASVFWHTTMALLYKLQECCIMYMQHFSEATAISHLRYSIHWNENSQWWKFCVKDKIAVSVGRLHTSMTLPETITYHTVSFCSWWPSNAIWWCRTRSSLAEVMACCLMANFYVSQRNTVQIESQKHAGWPWWVHSNFL